MTRFAVPDSSSSLDTQSLENLPQATSKLCKVTTIIQDFGCGLSEGTTAANDGIPARPVQVVQSDIIPVKRSTAFGQVHDAGHTTRKIGSKGTSLRKRISTLFNGSSAPNRARQRFDGRMNASRIGSGLSTLGLHEDKPPPAGRTALEFIDAIFEDGSSTADYSDRFDACSLITRTHHSAVNMQMLPISVYNSVDVNPPYTHQTNTAFLSSPPRVPNLGVFDSRNGGSPVRGLYRNGLGHHEQLVDQRLASPLSAECEALEPNVDTNDSEWTDIDSDSKRNTEDLLKLIPADNKVCHQLACLPPAYRKGIYIPPEPTLSLPPSTPMDTEYASRHWQIQPESESDGTDVNANTAFYHPTSPTTLIIPDSRDADIFRTGPGCGRSIIHSITCRPSQTYRAAAGEATAQPGISITASDDCEAMHLRQARAQVHTGISHSHASRGKIASTTQPPTPLSLPSTIYATTESSTADLSTTAKITALVTGLERERDNLASQNQTLLAALRTAYADLGELGGGYAELQMRARREEVETEELRRLLERGFGEVDGGK